MRLETKRLYLRRLTAADAAALSPVLRDAEVMYAWEHAFSEDEVQDWLQKNFTCYAADDRGYLAVIRKESGELIGVTGLLNESINGEIRLGIGWIYAKGFWGKGYAFEGAQALVQAAFDAGEPAVVATIRPENYASCRLAERLGMQPVGSFVRRYREKDMEHLIYELTTGDSLKSGNNL